MTNGFGPPPLGTNDVYAAFVGVIDQPAAQRIVQGITTAMANRVTHLHLLFQSAGGFVGDGVFLYNFFRALSLPLTIYNLGGVYSIGTIAYLGAERRKVSTYASFMVHRSTATPKTTTAIGLEAAANSLMVDDARTEAILRNRTKLSDEHWRRIHAGEDVTIGAAEAESLGFATQISEFEPPDGAQIYHL